MASNTLLKRMAAGLLILTLLICSFPVAYTEEEMTENVTEEVVEAVADVTEPEAAAQPAPAAEVPAEAEAVVTEPEPAAEVPAEAEAVVTEPEPAAEVPAEAEVVAEPEPAAEVPAETEAVMAEPEPAAEPEPVAEVPVEAEPETTDDSEEDTELDFEDDFDFDGDGFVEFDDDDMGHVSDELLEQFNNPALYEKLEFTGSADIVLKDGMDIYLNGEVILVAKVKNANMTYRIVWEANDNDEKGWHEVGSGEEYSYTLTLDNVDREYRAVLFATDD